MSLPDGSGYDLCEKFRETSKVPVIFLAAADEEMDIIMGLDIGGDDYITKPFKLAVFLSRINALLRRSDNFNQADTELESNGIKVQRLKGEVYKNGEQLDLTASEYKLLCLFMENAVIQITDYISGNQNARIDWKLFASVVQIIIKDDGSGIILFLSFSVLIEFIGYIMPQLSNTSDINISSNNSSNSIDSVLPDKIQVGNKEAEIAGLLKCNPFSDIGRIMI